MRRGRRGRLASGVHDDDDGAVGPRARRAGSPRTSTPRPSASCRAAAGVAAGAHLPRPPAETSTDAVAEDAVGLVPARDAPRERLARERRQGDRRGERAIPRAVRLRGGRRRPAAGEERARECDDDEQSGSSRGPMVGAGRRVPGSTLRIVSWVDIVIIVWVALAALRGRSLGALTQLLSLVGFVVGLAIGAVDRRPDRRPAARRRRPHRPHRVPRARHGGARRDRRQHAWQVGQRDDAATAPRVGGRRRWRGRRRAWGAAERVAGRGPVHPVLDGLARTPDPALRRAHGARRGHAAGALRHRARPGVRLE